MTDMKTLLEKKIIKILLILPKILCFELDYVMSDISFPFFGVCIVCSLMIGKKCFIGVLHGDDFTLFGFCTVNHFQSYPLFSILHGRILPCFLVFA